LHDAVDVFDVAREVVDAVVEVEDEDEEEDKVVEATAA